MIVSFSVQSVGVNFLIGKDFVFNESVSNAISPHEGLYYPLLIGVSFVSQPPDCLIDCGWRTSLSLSPNIARLGNKGLIVCQNVN